MRNVQFSLFWRATGLKNLTESCDPDKRMRSKHSAQGKTLKKGKKNSFSPESVIFVKPVARRKSGNYTLRMIMKVAYKGFACSRDSIIYNNRG